MTQASHSKKGSFRNSCGRYKKKFSEILKRSQRIKQNQGNEITKKRTNWNPEKGKALKGL